MAIRNVVTRGFGPGAAIKFVVTRGYSIAAVSGASAIGKTATVIEAFGKSASLAETYGKKASMTNG